MRKARLWIFLLILLAGAGGGVFFWLDLQATLNAPLAVGGKPRTIAVVPGSSIEGIARDLATAGILPEPWWYLPLEARRTGRHRAIKAGEYEILPGLSALGLLDKMVRGEVAIHKLTLVEGRTFADALAVLVAHPKLVHTLAGVSPAALPAEVMARLGHPGEHPEGRIFPDTYRIDTGTTDLDLLQAAYRAMEKTLTAEWAERAQGLPYKSPYEALIMASIIEKETAKEEERPQIAGVFVRRMHKGMRLETDPTVIYGMGARYAGKIHRADLEEQTPYNTYRIPGLPPSPIALPGRAALHAALHPAAGDSLFFVARGDGSHQFSATRAEHEAAVDLYQRHKTPPNPNKK